MIAPEKAMMMPGIRVSMINLNGVSAGVISASSPLNLKKQIRYVIALTDAAKRLERPNKPIIIPEQPPMIDPKKPKMLMTNPGPPKPFDSRGLNTAHRKVAAEKPKPVSKPFNIIPAGIFSATAKKFV